MTRKDFQLIAGALRVAGVSVSGNKDAETAVALVAEILAQRLAPTNPAFDKSRFITATRNA